MVDRDYAPLSSACVRALVDKQYDKRRAAAGEIEKMVKQFVSVGNTTQIKKILKVLGHEFALSQNTNFRKGGLLGLAAVALSLGKDSAEYTEALIHPILTNFQDSDVRIRYSACESLFNVVKVARGAVLPYFTDIFVALSKLAVDPDQTVKNGTELLDRLMKDIVTENATFDLVGFMPLLRDRLYSNNPFARQFIISWVSVLDAVPDIHLIMFLPEILDGLFNMLSDNTLEIKKMCETVLDEFLRSINKDPSCVNFIAMINVLITHSQGTDDLVQLTSVTWIRDFIHLAGDQLLPHTSGILMAILPCLAYDGGSKKSLKETAKAVNDNLMALIIAENNITNEDNDNNSESTGNEEKNVSLNLKPVLDVLTKQLIHTSVPTKVAALKWIYQLHKSPKTRASLVSYVSALFPELLEVLSDHSDEVVQQVLIVLSEIISPNYPDSRSPYFEWFLCELLSKFRNNSMLLEKKGSFIIRQLCLLLCAERIYQNMAVILRNEDDVKFVRVMVDTLNTILLTSSELFHLRSQLKNGENVTLFRSLYATWCHNPIATISLCLLTQNYCHTCDLISILSNYEMTVELLAEVDRLIQLIESPIFIYLRLQLLDLSTNYYLVRALCGLLMLIPQSEAFHTLKNRLACVPMLQFQTKDRTLKTDENCLTNKYTSIDFHELVTDFERVQNVHREKRLFARNEAAKNLKGIDI